MKLFYYLIITFWQICSKVLFLTLRDVFSFSRFLYFTLLKGNAGIKESKVPKTDTRSLMVGLICFKSPLIFFNTYFGFSILIFTDIVVGYIMDL